MDIKRKIELNAFELKESASGIFAVKYNLENLIKSTNDYDLNEVFSLGKVIDDLNYTYNIIKDLEQVLNTISDNLFI